MSETSSSSSRTPCWGLVCKLWSFDLHPLPYLNKLINKFFILSRKKTPQTKQLTIHFQSFSPFPLRCWRAHPLRILHAPQTRPSRGPFCKYHTTRWATGQRRHIDHYTHQLTELTFAGPMDSGWLFSPRRLRAVWADERACLRTFKN